MISEYMLKRQALKNGTREPDPKKVQQPIAKKSAKKIEQEKKEKKSKSVECKEETLNDWFQKIEDKHWGNFDEQDGEYDHPDNEVRCMECGNNITRPFARHATAHLLPKKIFKSVATNDLNYLILGAGCGCHDKTHRIDKFVTMKIWPQAAKQINELLKILPHDELMHVSQQLYDALENY